MPRNCRSISVSGSTYDRMKLRAERDGVAVSCVLESALGYLPSSGPLPEVAAVDVSLDLYQRVGKVARRLHRSYLETLDSAILRALDDAEAYPARRKAKRRPMVDHARRAA